MISYEHRCHLSSHWGGLSAQSLVCERVGSLNSQCISGGSSDKTNCQSQSRALATPCTQGHHRPYAGGSFQDAGCFRVRSLLHPVGTDHRIPCNAQLLAATAPPSFVKATHTATAPDTEVGRPLAARNITQVPPSKLHLPVGSLKEETPTERPCVSAHNNSSISHTTTPTEPAHMPSLLPPLLITLYHPCSSPCTNDAAAPASFPPPSE